MRFIGNGKLAHYDRYGNLHMLLVLYAHESCIDHKLIMSYMALNGFKLHMKLIGNDNLTHYDRHGVTISSQRVFSLTIVFFLRVRSWTLCAQWTCHVLRTRLSHIHVSRITCHQLVYSYVPVSASHVFLLVQMWTVDSLLVTCLFSVSPFVLSTCTLTFLAYAFLRLSHRLVSMLTFIAYAFLLLSCQLVSRFVILRL